MPVRLLGIFYMKKKQIKKNQKNFQLFLGIHTLMERGGFIDYSPVTPNFSRWKMVSLRYECEIRSPKCPLGYSEYFLWKKIKIKKNKKNFQLFSGIHTLIERSGSTDYSPVTHKFSRWKIVSLRYECEIRSPTCPLG